MISYFRQCGILFSNDREHFLIREHLVLIPFVAVKWHVLDEAYFDGAFTPHFDKWDDFPVIDPPHHNAVDLQLDPRTHSVHLQDPVNTFQNGIQSLASGHDLVLERIERIQTEIYPCQPRLDHGIEFPMQRNAVCCQTQLPQPIMA